MGDADSTQILMSAEDVEHWMDHALNDVDQGLDILFSFMNLLNERTVQMISELMAWHRFRRCFAAFNLFVVPIMLAIGLVYGGSETLEPSSGIEAVLQMVVMLLMFLSWSVGFPLYIFSMWQTYFIWRQFPHVSSRRVCGEWNTDSDGTTRATVDESRLSLPFVEDSILHVGRMVNRRMRDNIRMEFQRRVNRVAEEAEVATRGTSLASSETSDNFDDNDEVPEINLQRQTETGVLDLPEAGGTLSDIVLSGLHQKEHPEKYGVQVIILKASKELSAEIDKHDSPGTMQESGQEPSDNQNELPEGVSDVLPTSGIRSIPVENIGEGHYISDTLKEKDSTELVDCCWGEN